MTLLSHADNLGPDTVLQCDDCGAYFQRPAYKDEGPFCDACADRAREYLGPSCGRHVEPFEERHPLCAAILYAVLTLAVGVFLVGLLIVIFATGPGP